jgi:hypothetical protein
VAAGQAASSATTPKVPAGRHTCASVARLDASGN